MRYLSLLLIFFTIISCSSSSPKKTVNKSPKRPINAAKSKGMIVMYQEGNNSVLNFKLKKDRTNAILTLTKFGFTAAELYMKGDSVWVIIPSEKVVYFQDKSNILLVPNLKTDDVPIGMLLDYLVANFSFKYSIVYNEADLDLIESIRNVNYGFIDGDLAAVEYNYGQSIMSTSITHIGDKIKLNLKRNRNLLMSISIENIVLQADMDPKIFVPTIPEGYQLVKL